LGFAVVVGDRGCAHAPYDHSKSQRASKNKG
jgi:hypothetical protein